VHGAGRPGRVSRPVPGWVALLVRFADAVSAAYLWLALVMVIGFVLVVFVDVVYRQILKRPMLETADLAILLFVWSTMTAAAVAVRKNLHFNIDVVPGWAKGNSARARWFVVDIASFVFFVIITWLGVETAMHAMNRTFPMSGYPIGWAVAALPFCGAASVLFLFERLVLRGYGALSMIESTEVRLTGSAS